MFQALKSNLWRPGGNGFLCQTHLKTCALILALLLLPLTASAYTLVLKGGRRVEIPDTFITTSLTLTYEAAPDVNVTLLLVTIDVPATEKANNERAGSFFNHGRVQIDRAATNQRPRAKRRELTQAEIEKARAERQKSAEAYERHRVELGLPTLEESRRRNEEQDAWLREESLKSQAETTQAERYWRERAQQLIAEMTAVDAEMNYVRSRLDETPDYSSISSYGFITGTTPLLYPGFATTRFPVVVGNPGFMRAPNSSGAQGAAGFIAFGGMGPQAGPRINPGFGRGIRGRPGHIGRGGSAPGSVFYGLPGQNYDYSYERSSLISRLRELETTRSGLQARWDLLEDEARRAGAQPGWLRP